MKNHVLVFLCLCTIAGAAPAWTEETGAASSEGNLENPASRYGFEDWPGKEGPVVAGITLEPLSAVTGRLAVDHRDWLEADGEWILTREFSTADHSLTIDVAVARTCRGAQELLFAHLTRQTVMKSLDPPALPCGRVRLTDTGDVCFGLPQHGGEGYHSVEFARNNVVIFLRTDGEATGDLSSIATAIDALILSQPVFPDWRSSRLWISIDRFEIPDARARAGSMVPLVVSVSDPRNEAYTRDWEVSAGGILEEDGEISYYAEGSGRQSITLLVADESGLAASARAEIEVVR